MQRPLNCAYPLYRTDNFVYNIVYYDLTKVREYL